MANSVVENRFPSQIKYIVGNEAAERFSFYGMRSILVVFMVQKLLMAEHESKAIFHLFVSACYLTPLLGAFIADRLWGKYKTILYISLLYCVGHGVLAVWESKAGLYVGLALIALGSGGIKPCVSAYVGDQFGEKNKHLISKVYDIFYWSINFGSFFSTMLIPWILPRYGSGLAFGIPGILMGIATFIFWMGRKQYVIVPPVKSTEEASFAQIFFYSIKNLGKRKAGQKSFLDVASSKFKASEIEGAKAAWSIFKVFLAVSIFWALYDQHSSSWILQAQQMDLNVWGMKFEASQIAALNPIMVMAMIPLFSMVIYPGIEKLTGFKMTPLRRIAGGMFVTASSFAIVGGYQVILDSGHQLNVAWHFIPFLVLTAAEIMVSITGLEFAYTQAPRSMKSTIMSFWFLTIFAGNLLTAYVSEVNVFKGASYFFFFAVLMALVSVIFLYVAKKYKTHDYLEKGSNGVAKTRSQSESEATSNA